MESNRNCLEKISLMRRREEAEREAEYTKIAAEYGYDVVEALKSHFAIYDERFYLWLADLYDPGEYDAFGNALGGGFYYSNSARDNDGFYIDVESTMQALAFLRDSGMLAGYGGNLSDAIPEKMKSEMVAFVLSCQSAEDGCFYHKQWGKDIAPARRGRDLGWSTRLLASFGKMPIWDTPNGHKGERGRPCVANCGKETNSSSVWPEYLTTVSGWREYLRDYTKELPTRSYPIGHVIAEQAAQIKTRESEALASGEAAGYISVTAEIFNSSQNSDTGLWENAVTYNSVNGLMKIMALYNSLGIRLNYPERAFRAACEVILHRGADANGKEATGSVDVYNPWIAITRIFDNIKRFGEPEKIELLRKELHARAAEMIRVTTEKTLKFRKEDGSYGYTQAFSPQKSQGVCVAVPNTVEGDVNGGTIALVGVTVNMLSALGIEGVSIYYPSDFCAFIDRASRRTHIIKK